ncbi:hypothetical protein HG535_0F01460 [Zygotorulaspora mrakii]|uniref:Probable transporter MCH1 n=1 Tax=Zygotorulaspora mrakii TaxID=42260 RepID=A0A7H9B4M2_ZYGMR|nr:uncharacterized protein HG535_0F01460 [Zygotorulaspora mrakii]QLG73635.1 hypothetical protein HG535_0F01460 [Zygotorulaspora mrakii]
MKIRKTKKKKNEIHAKSLGKHRSRSKPQDMALSQVEHYLTYHVRQLLPHVLSKRSSKHVAYVFSLLSAVSSGFIVMISLYSDSWEKQLHYSAWQINMIASLANLGMYLTPPILGFLADTHGPITLSALGIIGFIPSYSYVAYIFNHPALSNDHTFHLILMSFTVMGVSTSSLYFSALITCAKLYPDKRTLSISLPTTCYGLSSFLGSQLLNLPFFWSTNGDSTFLNLGRVFNTFACVYAVVGLLAWIATSTVSMFKHAAMSQQESCRNGNEDMDQNENDPLIAVEPVQERLAQKQFFKDPVALFVGISMILSLGPSEMFLANMGSLTKLLVGENAVLSSRLLSVYAVLNTVTRLSSGFITDFLATRDISPKWILISLLSLSLMAQFLITNFSLSTTVVSPLKILLIGAMMGTVYGGLFTAYPVIILAMWGDKLFGTAYGSMMIAPAIGSVVSCMAYADIFDSKCVTEDTNATSCIAPVFEITSAQLIICILVTVVVLRRH